MEALFLWKERRNIMAIGNMPLTKKEKGIMDAQAAGISQISQDAYKEVSKVGARDYLGSLIGAGNVGYDPNTKGITATIGGKTYDLGNEGLTLGEDNRYYAPNSDYLNQLLLSKTGYLPVRDTLQTSGDTVDWADGQLIVGGKEYNTGGQNGYVNIDGTLYASEDKINALKTPTYVNPYDDQTQSLLKKLMTNIDKGFTYDPASDTALQQAQDQAQRSVVRDTARRGILNSTDTAYYSGLAASQLVPQYEQMAYGRYQDKQTNYFNLVNTLSNMNAQELQVWQANQTEKYNGAMLTLNTKAQKLNERNSKFTEALNRTDLTGFVSNPDALILGVEPGTLSQAKREMIEKEKLDIAAEKRKLADAKELITFEINENTRALGDTLAIKRADTNQGIRDAYNIDMEYAPKIAEQNYNLSELYPAGGGVRSSGGGGGGSSGGGGGGSKGSGDGYIEGLLGGDGNGGNGDATVSNAHSSDMDWVYVRGYGRLTWGEIKAMVERGEIEERYDSGTNTYTYVKSK